MSDTEKPATEKPATEKVLTDYALRRMRALAEGNGLDPLKIKVNNSEEKDVTLTGTMTLTPKSEIKTQTLKGRKLKLPEVEKSFSNAKEMTPYVAEKQKAFQESTDWYTEVLADLDKLPGKGWGIETARVIFDNRPAVHFSASETCVKCMGNGTLTCEFCAGNGYTPCQVCYQRGTENCYTCFGNGMNPQDQNLPCPTCNGTRFAICRTCQGRKGIPCGNCHANGHVMCEPCQGGGKIVELSTLEFGAETAFAPGSGAELPSAVRRAMDRAGGVKVLANGHATIDYTKPKDEDKRPGLMVLNYTAQLRTADLVIQFGDEAKRIAVFGHKRTFLEVPAFLDTSLTESLELLKQTGVGKGNIDKVLDVRVFKEACGFILKGSGTVEQLRKLYPQGLSKPMMQQILQLMRKALARQTMVARWAGFLAAFVLADVLGGALYLTPAHKTLLANGAGLTLAVEILVPLFCAALGFLLTGQAALFHLQRRFPDTKLAVHHHSGLLGVAAAIVAFAVPCLIALMQPEGVQWLHFFKR